MALTVGRDDPFRDPSLVSMAQTAGSADTLGTDTLVVSLNTSLTLGTDALVIHGMLASLSGYHSR